MSDTTNNSQNFGNENQDTTDGLITGSSLGQYRIIRQLGKGGMGSVYEADHAVLGRRYAIKILNDELNTEKGLLDRLKREAHVLANLEHPNIVKVDEFGETDDKLWLRMELIEGRKIGAGDQTFSTLQDLMNEENISLDEVEASRLLRGILEGLSYAHGKGAIHRDLKPANILLTQDGLKIADFGLVKLAGEDWYKTRIQESIVKTMVRIDTEKTIVESSGITGSVGSSSRAMMGTFEYMSPELKEGVESTIQSDIYAVGLIAFKLLTGEVTPGFELPSSINPKISKEWDSIIRISLNTNPSKRFQDAGAMLEALSFTTKFESSTYVAPEPADSEVQPVDDTNERISLVCPNCSEDNELSSDYCKRCGRRLRDNCKSCSAEVRLLDETCGECGFDLKNFKTAVRVRDEVSESFESSKFGEAEKQLAKVEIAKLDALKPEFRNIRKDLVHFQEELFKKKTELLDIREVYQSHLDNNAFFEADKDLSKLETLCFTETEFKECQDLFSKALTEYFVQEEKIALAHSEDAAIVESLHSLIENVKPYHGIAGGFVNEYVDSSISQWEGMVQEPKARLECGQLFETYDASLPKYNILIENGSWKDASDLETNRNSDFERLATILEELGLTDQYETIGTNHEGWLDSLDDQKLSSLLRITKEFDDDLQLKLADGDWKQSAQILEEAKTNLNEYYEAFTEPETSDYNEPRTKLDYWESFEATIQTGLKRVRRKKVISSVGFIVFVAVVGTGIYYGVNEFIRNSRLHAGDDWNLNFASSTIDLKYVDPNLLSSDPAAPAIIESYWLATTEVTVAQFREFVESTGYEPSDNLGVLIPTVEGFDLEAHRSWQDVFADNDSNPVVGVSWNDAMEFCNWLTMKEREDGRLTSEFYYTLPTESQWEYACRASGFELSEDEQQHHAWVNENSGDQARAVAINQPNEWGFFDMKGNAWEWCKLSNAGETQTQPIRGGSWFNSMDFASATSRDEYEPNTRVFDLGFRIACQQVNPVQ